MSTRLQRIQFVLGVLFSKRSKLYDRICFEKDKHAKLCNIILKQSEKHIETKSKEKNDNNNEEKEKPEAKPSFQDMVPISDLCHFLPRVNWTGSCKFGDVFLQRVGDWAAKLQWPMQPAGCVSMLELYVDFVIHTGTQVPVPVSKNKDRSVESYQLRDLSSDAKIVSLTLGEQSVIWARFHKWALQNQIFFWNDGVVPPSSCLSHVGYSLRAVAIANRPVFVSGIKPMVLLHKLFHTPTGKVRNLNIPFNGVT